MRRARHRSAAAAPACDRSQPPRQRGVRRAGRADVGCRVALPRPPADRRRASPPRRRATSLAPIRRWLFGGNTIVKAGVGILFVGLAFLAKYASEHAHLPVEVRLAAIGAAAVVLLGFGWRLRLSRPDYAQVLQGGAVAVLYLTLFAAFRYYGVLAATPAFVLMVAVAALAAALAVLQDARALAVIGALGGFATPLIVSTGSNNYVALFAYYFVLDAGIAARRLVEDLAAAQPDRLRRHLRRRDGLGRARVPARGRSRRSQAFLIAFFLLFVAILVLPARRLARGAPARRRSAARRRLGQQQPAVRPADGHVRARVRAGARHAVRRRAGGARARRLLRRCSRRWMRRRPELGITFEATLAIATVFLTLVIPFALDERSTAGAWTLEGAGLVWIGFRQRRGLPRAFGYLLLADRRRWRCCSATSATARRRWSSTPISSTA